MREPSPQFTGERSARLTQLFVQTFVLFHRVNTSNISLATKRTSAFTGRMKYTSQRLVATGLSNTLDVA
jgi:hypothetical protein